MAVRKCTFCNSTDIEVEEKYNPIKHRNMGRAEIYLVYCYECTAEYSCTRSMDVTKIISEPIFPITSVYNDDNLTFPPEEEEN